MQIQFWGATREVTGSMHLLTVDGKNILLDCGLYQGHRSEANKRNSEFPFDPASIDCMILSHAHIDHSGNIPQLIKKGYNGNVFCTHATQDLASVMLRDSAHIQEKDAEFLNKRLAKKGMPPIEPLYVMKDAENCITHFVGLGYGRPFYVTPNVKLTFQEAGHILGSAMVILDITENGQTKRLTFTGDLGRKHLPIIKDPYQIKETDYLIMESTYGNRVHDPIEDMKAELKQIVNKTVSRRGKIIVPSFSVGRTQELVYFLHQLFQEGSIPEIPIYVDSPLSVNITEVFRLHPEIYDKETNEAFLEKNEDPFGFYRLKYIRHVEDSKNLNNIQEPCMIISASGMCEAGRILHHLANNVQNPNNTILVVGYMAENTLGRRIVDKERLLKIYGEEIPLNAEVAVMHGFSAHADQKDLLNFISKIDVKKPEQVFIVHGEIDQQTALSHKIKELGIAQVHIPERGQKYTL